MQYSFSSKTKGLREGLMVAAAMWVALKLEGSGFPLRGLAGAEISGWRVVAC